MWIPEVDISVSLNCPHLIFRDSFSLSLNCTAWAPLVGQRDLGTLLSPQPQTGAAGVKSPNQLSHDCWDWRVNQGPLRICPPMLVWQATPDWPASRLLLHQLYESHLIFEYSCFSSIGPLFQINSAIIWEDTVYVLHSLLHDLWQEHTALWWKLHAYLIITMDFCFCQVQYSIVIDQLVDCIIQAWCVATVFHTLVLSITAGKIRILHL